MEYGEHRSDTVSSQRHFTLPAVRPNMTNYGRLINLKLPLRFCYGSLFHRDSLCDTLYCLALSMKRPMFCWTMIGCACTPWRLHGVSRQVAYSRNLDIGILTVHSGYPPTRLKAPVFNLFHSPKQGDRDPTWNTHRSSVCSISELLRSVRCKILGQGGLSLKSSTLFIL